MAEATPEQTKQKGKGSLGKLLFVVINTLLFLGGLSFFLLTKFGVLAPSIQRDILANAHANDPHQQASPVDPSLSLRDAALMETVTVSVEPFVVNLSDKGGRRFLNLAMQVEVVGEKNKEEIEKRLPRIRNRLIFLLSSKTYADISSADGKYELQDEIRHHVNEVVGTPLVKRVLFTRLVVQ